VITPSGKIFGEVYIRKARVATIGGLSAHAGQTFLLEYALASRDRLKKIILVHGEARGAQPLMERLGEAGIKEVYFPETRAILEI